MQTDYDIAYAASRGISFSPERRATAHAAEIAQTREDIKKGIETIGQNHGIPAERIAQAVEHEVRRAHRLWCAWMGARSRCMSSAITGPANFPVQRMTKCWDIERRRGQEFYAAVGLAKCRAIKRMGIPRTGGGIRTGEAGAAEALTHEIKTEERAHACMVGTNKVLRQYREANDRRKALADLGLQSQTIENLLARIPDGRTRGFEQFSLANSSANIRRLKQQLKAALVLANTCKDWGWEQGEILAKVEDGRVWLVFPGKPDAETISRLKRSAFKWSPSRTAWVRADTQAARWAANQFKVAA